MGVLGHFLYRPSFGAKGQAEYLAFDGGLVSADAEIYASQLHRLATSNVHGLIFTGPGSGGGLDADRVDGKHASEFLISEADPIFAASPAYGITVTNISNWNTAFGWGNHAGLYSLLGHNHSGVYDPAGTGDAEATAHVDVHKDLTTGVHGVGIGTIAKVSDIAATKLDAFTAPDDNTTLDAITTKHGLMPKTDKVKLDGVEAGATKYPDTGEQAFLDADHSKLDGIEASAVALATVKGDADVADAISKKHSANADTDLDSTFEATFVKHNDVDDTPVDGETDDPISSNWAFDHVAAADPHTGYRLESADHSHQSTGAQAGKLDHGLALDGLGDDDHTQYRLESVDHSHQSTGAEAGQLDHGLALTIASLTDDDHPQYQLRCGVSARTATLSYAAGVFSATYVSDYNIWTNGVKWPITTTQTVALAANNTLYYIYFDVDGVMKASTVEWDLRGNTAPFALVFRVSAALAAIGDERHAPDRNRGLHAWAHESIGCRYDTLHGGLTGTFGATVFSITAGDLWDEDLQLEIIGVQTTCRQWSRTLAGAAMAFVDGATVLYSLNGANIQYDNAGTLTDAAVNRYVCHYVFATNDITVPIYSLIGQAQHVNLADAQNEAVPAFAGLTTVEWKLLYKVIYRNTGSPPTYVGAQDYRNVAGVPTTFAPTAHASLTGLDADDHTQYVLRSLFTEQGDLAYRNATIWAALAHGTAGQVLITGGDAANPSWSSAPTITFANANHTHQAAGTGGQLDHGLALTGLADDDHSIYALLAGRAGGQTLIGGSAVTDILKLQGTSGNGTLTSPAIQGLVGNAGGTIAFTVLNNGNFGIGTTSPGAALDVNGQILAARGTNVLPSLADRQTVATGINFRGGNSIDGVLGGAAFFSLNSNGFQIKSTSSFAWSAGDPTVNAPDTGLFRGAANKVYVGNGTAGDYSGTLIAGNVGIQTTTPTANLQVAQRTAGVGTITTSGTAVTGVGTQFLNTFKVGDTIVCAGQTKTIATITTNTALTTDAWSPDIAVATAYTLTGGTRFSVLGNGNVGIGMTPTYTLDVTGNLRCSTGFGCNGTIPQTAYASGGALAAYATGAFGLDSDVNMSALHALVVKIRAAMVANGIMS